MVNALNEFSTLAKAKHEEAVSRWTERPGFKVELTITQERMTMTIIPTGPFAERWTWIDQGTGLYGPKKRPYVIMPKKPGGHLVFQTGYSPKTEPIANSNAGTGTASGPWVSKEMVIHPGIRPRKFTEKFEEDLKPDFRRLMENAFRRAVRRR